MNRIGVAFRALFAALGSAETAERIAAVLSGKALPKIDGEAKQPPAARPMADPPPNRSEAITLLAALQREARLVDLVKQPLTDFSDEEIGAAARTVLGDCATVLDRFFALGPVVTQDEGADCQVPHGYDPARYKLTGAAQGSGPFKGKLAHQGWQASTVKLPAWTGSKDAALVISPAEVEV
jgi:Domain of unknown function (DUF2760)